MSGIATYGGVGTNSGIVGQKVPIGSIVKTSTVTTGNTKTTLSTGHSWDDTVVTAAFTPTYVDSSIIINCHFSTYAQAASPSANSGFAFRWERAISGGATSEPASMMLGSANSANPQGYLAINDGGTLLPYNLATAYSHVLMDSPATTAEVTYKLECASYNTGASSYLGALNTSAWWHLYFMEVKR